MSLKTFIIAFLSFGLISACNSPQVADIPENIAQDELELFRIDNSADTILYTEDEIIIHIAANSVVDDSGVPIADYDMSFAGFIDAADALSSNLTTTTREGLLNSSAIIYASVTRDGTQLSIDPDTPITFDIPDYYDNDNIKVYRPEDPENVDRIWQELPQSVFLTALDFDLLDFLPEGFSDSANETFGNGLSPEAVDSIYYALEAYEPREIIELLAYGAEHSKFLYMVKQGKGSVVSDIEEQADTISTSFLTPAAIKVLKNPKFKNTFIATRAFEERLKHLHRTHCYEWGLLETYIENLHEPMWVSDSIIFFQKRLDHPLRSKFEEFYLRKTTNTPNAPESSSELFKYFVSEIWKERDKIRNEQAKSERVALRAMKSILRKQAKFIESKETLLKKRESYRMKRFGFEMTSTGWYNFAIPARPEDLEKFEMDVTIENGPAFQHTYAYVVNPKIFSLYALKSEDNMLFDQSFMLDKHLLIWKNQKVIITGIGKEKGKYAYNRVDWKVEKVNHISLTLQDLSFKDLKKTLRKLPLKKRENKIIVELRIDEKLAQQDSLLLLEIEKKEARQAALKYLFKKAYPCSFGNESSERVSID